MRLPVDGLTRGGIQSVSNVVNAGPVGSRRSAFATTRSCSAGYDATVATLEDLEARVAALEATQADYRAALAAVNALGANQRELAEGQRRLNSDVAALINVVAGVENTLIDTNARVRSMEKGQAEIKDLLIRALDTF